MRRLLLVLVLVPLTVITLNVGVAAASGANNPPPKCFRSDSQGDLPTCTYSGGQWQVSYPGSGLGGSGGGMGVPGWFVGLGILIVIGGIGVTVWRVSIARRMASSAGMNPNQATAVALLDSPGLDAAYLAANLRSRPAPTPASTAPASVPPAVADRLRDLAALHDQGLITPEEYAARRTAIIDSV